MGDTVIQMTANTDKKAPISIARDTPIPVASNPPTIDPIGIVLQLMNLIVADTLPLIASGVMFCRIRTAFIP